MSFLNRKLFWLWIFLSLEVNSAVLRDLTAQEEIIKTDLSLILEKANIKFPITFERSLNPVNSVKVSCEKNKIHLEIQADDNWGQVFYYGLQKLGFLFPHPRWQISPSREELKNACGKTFLWKPALKYHGFHLHTLHPNEWVHGFLLGKTGIANDMIRWLARNQQNLIDLSILQIPEEKIFKNLKVPFALAKKMGIHTGVVVGFTFHQQNQYKLMGLWSSLFEDSSLKELEINLNRIFDNLDLSFVNIEAGTSEFTPADYDLSIKWMNKAANLAKKRNIATFIKIHTSTGQSNEKYGNFNLLPQYADKNVGILPHTVFFYDVNAEKAPMYGNENFHHIRDFMLQENSRRPTWFYPETSYYCVMDIDVPLFFTDYLISRAKDTKFLFDNNIEGQLNFSTGHELGYWLFDWTYTLLNNLDYNFDEMIGLKLIGEDINSWKEIISFQHKHFALEGLAGIISFSSLGDELLPGLHKVHKRNLLSELAEDEKKLKKEIELLKTAIKELPVNVIIKNDELKAMWKITEARLFHALANRMAMLHPKKKDDFLNESAIHRSKAKGLIEFVADNFNRYPKAKIFVRHDNPTAYKFGYGQPAKDMQYWIREEEAIRQENYNFWFMSQYSIYEVFSGWVL